MLCLGRDRVEFWICIPGKRGPSVGIWGLVEVGVGFRVGVQDLRLTSLFGFEV